MDGEERRETEQPHPGSTGHEKETETEQHVEPEVEEAQDEEPDEQAEQADQAEQAEQESKHSYPSSDPPSNY